MRNFILIAAVVFLSGCSAITSRCSGVDRIYENPWAGSFTVIAGGCR